MRTLIDRIARRGFNIGLEWFTRLNRHAVKSDIYYSNVYHRLANRLSRAFVSQQSAVMPDSWDHLLVLDGCRYDTFVDQNHLEGTLARHNAASGWTKEWALRNFANEDFSDTVYVSATPTPSNFVEWTGENPFHAVEDVWTYGWDDERNTCPPEEVRKAAVRCLAEYPEKRLVVHFLQPHAPFIGQPSLSSEPGGPSIWALLRKGHVAEETVREAYRGNLDLVLQEVAKLLPFLDGRVVVTSDHGNCFGELNLFGHPGALVPAITDVPWLEVDCERKYDPADAEPTSQPDAERTQELRDERLRSLGYID